MKKLPDVSFRKNFSDTLKIEVVSFKALRKILKQPMDHDPFKPHRLKFNVLLVVTEGKTGVHNIDFKEHTYHDRSIITIAKDQIHCFIDLPNYNSGYLIMFTEELFLEFGISHPFLINHFYNNQLYNPIHRLRENDFANLISLLNKIIEKTNDKRKSVRMEIVQSYLKILLLEIFACREKQSKKIPDIHKPIL